MTILGNVILRTPISKLIDVEMTIFGHVILKPQAKNPKNVYVYVNAWLITICFRMSADLSLGAAGEESKEILV